MKRALGVVGGWLLLISVLFSTVVVPEVGATDTLAFYLRGNGVSWADLGANPPPARPLPNYDSVRNSDPGLTISRGGSGFNEFGWDKYQVWYSTTGGYDLNGEARLHLWSAVRGFQPVRGSITAYLMVCNGGGNGCELIATRQRDIDPWSDGDWQEQVFSFGTVSRAVASNERVAVKVIVSNASTDDMWLAYDTAAYDSRLVVTLGETVEPTTTTHPPDTTTTQPPTTTTTTRPPVPTTTTTRPPTTTTTTRPPTTTTTTRPPTTTTTTTTLPPTSTTTTTSAPGVTTTTLRPTTSTTPPPSTTAPPETTTTATPDTGLPVPPPAPGDGSPPPPPVETPVQQDDEPLIVALPKPIDPALAVAFRTPRAEPPRQVPVMVGLGVAFRSIVEQLRFNLLPAAMLSLLTAALMIMGLGPRRRRGTDLEA